MSKAFTCKTFGRKLIAVDKNSVVEKAKELGLSIRGVLFDSGDLFLIKFNQLMASEIKRNRIKRGLSQDNLAKTIGLSRTQIVNLESGKFNFSVMSLILISVALNISIDGVIKEVGRDE